MHKRTSLVVLLLFGGALTNSIYAGQAANPDPANNASNVSVNKTLQWTPDLAAVSHDIYFGTDFTDISNASRITGDLSGNGKVDWSDILLLTQYWLADPAGSEPYSALNNDNTVDLVDYALLSQNWQNIAAAAFKGNQASAFFNPGALDSNTTYYWRVDEVKGSGAVAGSVWSFKTVPLSSPPVYPYLSWAHDPANSIVVNWWNSNSVGDSTVDYGTSIPYASSANLVAASNFHHVELTGLSPSTTYHYRVRSGDGTISSDRTFTTADANAVSFSFAVYGDPRGQFTSNEPYYTYHRNLCNWIASQNYNFAIQTGDTVWAGAKTVAMPLAAQVFWTDFYNLEQNLAGSKAIMATLGGHETQAPDIGGTITYQYYYDLYTGAFPTNGPAGNTGRVYSFNYGNAHFVCLSSYQISITDQAAWLASDLAAVRANPKIKWIFAFAHEPLYTTGGHLGNSVELTYWGPLFDQYHVDIVFAAHNHCYERSKSLKAGAVVADGEGTVYMTVALGGAEFNPVGVAGNSSLFATLFGSNSPNCQTLAAGITINGSDLTVSAITNADSVVRDFFTLSK